jgi:hypothetical protein
MMRLVQFRDGDGRRAVAASQGTGHRRLEEIETIYELALAALESGESLAATAAGFIGDQAFDIAAAEREGRLLPALEHPVPTRCWVTASSAADGGTWFFRGSGSTLIAAGQPLPLPSFAPAGVPLPQLAGLYVISDDGVPCQLGWCLAHAVVDPTLASGHAHLRPTAIGPELLLGDLPPHITATRPGATAPHDLAPPAATLADLAHNHFRYPMHRRPGDVHIHCFSTPAARPPSPAAPDQLFELTSPAFGHPLRNRLTITTPPIPPIRTLG